MTVDALPLAYSISGWEKTVKSPGGGGAKVVTQPPGPAVCDR